MKTIGIIGAMPSEVANIRNSLGEPTKETHNTFEFYVYDYQGLQVISVCCGIGKVNAALCAQTLIQFYQVDAIINAGIAGGMDTKVQVCDIVVSRDVMHHDLLPRFLENYPPHNARFQTDERLVRLAMNACAKHNISCFVERIVSGETFVADPVLKAKIKEEFDPYAVDMESAGVGHACYLNGVPFVTIRCISDNANEEAEMSFEEFEIVAADKVAQVTLSMLNELAQ